MTGNKSWGALAVGVLSASLLVPASTAVALDASGVQLDFSDTNVSADYQHLIEGGAAPGDVGKGAPLGTNVIYESIATIGGTAINASVTYLTQSNLQEDSGANCDGRLNEIDDDDDDSYDNKLLKIESYLNLACDDDGTTLGYGVVRVEFLDAATSSPVFLENLSLNVYDVDNLQFVDFSGFSQYTISTESLITPSDKGQGRWRFSTPNENSSGSDGTDKTLGRVMVEFPRASNIDLYFGATTSGNASFDFDFSSGPAWEDTDTETDATKAAAVPVAAAQFEISYDANGGINAPSPTTATVAVDNSLEAAEKGDMSKLDHYFVSWNSRPDGSGQEIQPGETLNLTSDVTIYAQWSPNEELYIYPDEYLVFDSAELGADAGTVVIENFNESLFGVTTVFGVTTDLLVVDNVPLDPNSLPTTFDVRYEKDSETKRVTYNVKISDEDITPTTTTLPTDVSASVGDTVWASAYKRYLDTSVGFDGNDDPIDEYVYRITTEENVVGDSGSSVDLQSLEGYDFLTRQEQIDWYNETGSADSYQFLWGAFACVGTSNEDIVPATNFRTEYASLEDMVTESVIDGELNADFRHLVENWSFETDVKRTVVGLQDSSNVVGRWGYQGAPIASLKVVADCPEGYGFEVLPLLANDEYASVKSFELTDSLTVESRGTILDIDAPGITIGVTGEAPSVSFIQALWGLTTISAAPAGNGFGATSPFGGPVITDVGGDGQIADFNSAAGANVVIHGNNLGNVTSVTVGGVEAEVVSYDDSRITFTVPEGLDLGAQELVVTAGDQNIQIQEQIVITSNNASCVGQEPNLWTKRISETEAKVYIKCGTPGVSYRIDVQQNGGDYETLITRTLVDENDDRQVFNSVGRYIVRTIDLESKTRIRIFADDEKQWQVVYNQR